MPALAKKDLTRVIAKVSSRNLLLHHMLMQMFLSLRDTLSLPDIAVWFAVCVENINTASNRKEIIAKYKSYMKKPTPPFEESVELAHLAQEHFGSALRGPSDAICIAWVISNGITGAEALQYVYECFNAALPEPMPHDKADEDLLKGVGAICDRYEVPEKMRFLQSHALLKEAVHVKNMAAKAVSVDPEPAPKPAPEPEPEPAPQS